MSRVFRLRHALPARAVFPICLLLAIVGLTIVASSWAKADEPSAHCQEEFQAKMNSIDPYQPNVQVKGTVKVFGSTSMDAMAHAWGTNFKKFHQNAKVEIYGSGSETTFETLLKNPTGVAMLSRPVSEQEIAELQKKGLKKPVAFTVAREALGVFVHPKNPVKTISGEQLRLVFTDAAKGQKVTWGMLGATGEWANKEVRVISRSATSGTQRYLRDFVFAGANMREGVSQHVSNAEVMKVIQTDELAIGICGLGCKHDMVNSLQLVAGEKAIPSDDYTILTNQYPLTRSLVLLIDMGQTGAGAIEAQEFVHYALCRTAQLHTVIASFYPVDPPLLRASLQKLGAKQIR